ncbi:cellulose biosynthesis cyclic di-GMP-binding regulatory protein BcsB [Ochrobactrum sp. MR28]|nr:cellulose biosynthesis cyclic di-GMP-binding regulatory protein BcsB [Ochrobactrum sp. MR28]MBX8818652.1 cellulose biosynthesis cyclic di-GMP-binding regulatory protein BcsB [Ochrobactrum sp. MR31]
MIKRLTHPSNTIRRGILSVCLSVLPVSAPVFAQTDLPKPFNMAPEIGNTPTFLQPTAETTLPEENLNLPAVSQVSQPWRRYIVPSDILSLTGEVYAHSWNISLTAQEALAPARLNLGYQSTILIAPESSYFIINLNNIEILRQPIQSTDQLSEIIIDVPKDVFKQGENTLSIRAQQRHRTDCTIESTYELWTNIEPAKTYFTFDLPQLNTPSTNKGLVIDGNISAIGVNAKGGTQFNIVAPGLSKGDNGKSLLGLSQALAILGGMPNQSFSVEKYPSAASIRKDGDHSGELTVLVGTQNELADALETLQITPDVNNSEQMRFVSNARGEQFLLVSGETWREINQNIVRLVTMTERPANTLRSFLNTQNWNLPNAKMLRDATVLTFAELGIPTQQFSGRRLKNEFTFGIPADFYANAYGSATILLDAAYSAEVLPGSRIDIYVNGNIATTIPITNSGGGVMKQSPINISMRNFRPGLNNVTIEAALLTEADKSCGPGTASSNTPRFALFDTSKFSMPSFGRIGQTPNLAATASIAYPYNYTTDALRLLANLNDYNVLSASATIMGNLAIAAGRPLKITEIQPEDDLKSGNVLFIGAIVNLPDMVLAQAGLSPKAKGIWSDDDAGTPVKENGNFTLSQWQERLQSGWSGRLEHFYANMRETFNISDGLRLFPGEAAQFIPSKTVSVILAQGPSPLSTGAWTVVTAPDTVMLRHGVENLAQQINWTKIGGRISAYNREKQSVENLPVQNIVFLSTQPLSFTNIRLITTNWLSSNALSYVVLLMIALVALGLSTSTMLSRFGRRDDEK